MDTIKKNKIKKTINEMMIDRNYELKNIINEETLEYNDNLNNKTFILFIEKKTDFTKKIIKTYYNKYNINENIDTVIFIICFLNETEKIPIKYLNYENDYTQIFHMNKLLFNITHNKYVPQHIKLNDIEKNKLLEIYNNFLFKLIYIF